MKKFILNLRRKPEHIRLQIFFVLMVVSAAILFAFWVFITSSGIKDITSGNGAENGFDVFSSFKDNVLGDIDGFQTPQ